MSSITQVTTFVDLYTALRNATLDAADTATIEQAKRYINIALQDMHIGYGEKFPWAERRAILQTRPSYTTGTVSVSRGSAAVAGVDTAWQVDDDFGVDNVRDRGKICFSDPDVYEIAAVASDTSLTLSQVFVSTTLSGSGYTYFEDEYTLSSDFLKPLSARSFDRNNEIRLIPRDEFKRRFPRNKTPGKPKFASVIDLPPSGNATPIREVVFAPPPDDTYLFPYDFVTNKLAISSTGVAQQSLSAADDEPIVPFQYRHIILQHALYHWYRDKKDDTRSQEVKVEFTDLALRIIGDDEIGAKRPHINPRMESYARAAQRPWRGRSGRRYVAGTAFDQLRE